MERQFLPMSFTDDGCRIGFVTLAQLADAMQALDCRYLQRAARRKHNVTGSMADAS